MTHLPKNHPILELGKRIPSNKNELLAYLYDTKRYLKKEDYSELYSLIQSVESLNETSILYSKQFEYYRHQAGKLLEKAMKYQPAATQSPDLTVTNVVKHNAGRKVEALQKAGEEALKKGAGWLPYVLIGAGAVVTLIAVSQAKKTGAFA